MLSTTVNVITKFLIERCVLLKFPSRLAYQSEVTLLLKVSRSLWINRFRMRSVNFLVYCKVSNFDIQAMKSNWYTRTGRW